MGSLAELRAAGASWVHRLDPRTKIAFVVGSFAVLLPADHLVSVVGYLVMAHVLLWQARIPGERIIRVWRQLLPVTLLILILWPLFNPIGRPVLLDWWRIRITVPGVIEGLVAAIRMNGLAFAVSVLLLTTDQTAFVQGLVHLKMPFEWGLALAIGLRYLPLLHGTYGTIVDAQRARGWTPKRDRLLRRVRAYGPTLVALVVYALRLADNLTLALAARGFQPGRPRSVRRPLRLGRADRVCLVGVAVLTVGLVALEIVWW